MAITQPMQCYEAHISHGITARLCEPSMKEHTNGKYQSSAKRPGQDCIGEVLFAQARCRIYTPRGRQPQAGNPPRLGPFTYKQRAV